MDEATEKLAREAGLAPSDILLPDREYILMVCPDRLERFAALVRADERDKVADDLIDALQGDLENGVKWLNEQAAEEFNRKYKFLNAAIAALRSGEATNG